MRARSAGDAATRGRLAWIVLGCVGLLMILGLFVGIERGEGVDLLLIAWLSFPIVGALIASRQPRNAIGWIMLGIGVVGALSELFQAYAYYALGVQVSSLPGSELALALDQHLWVPALGLTGTFLILLFPDGRLPTRRWRPWAYFCGLAIVLCYTALVTLPGSLAAGGYPGVRNPLGIEALAPVSGAAISLVALIPVAFVGCAVALVRRFRRSVGLARLQLKWLTSASATVTATYALGLSLDLFVPDPDPPWQLAMQNVSVYSFVLIPIAIGLAIFRYRLYDIDVIINRTLVYGGLTAALAIAYFVLVAALQVLVSPLAGQSELAVAGSTLVVAALFRPARGRIQSLVDRRFYRSKFDAERTVSIFSARLREEVDLETLTADLLSIVEATMKPATSSLWLRPPTPAATGAEPAGSDERTREGTRN